MKEDFAPGIVVGVDGTPASRVALAFAMHEGLRRNSPVSVVTAWNWSGPYENISAMSELDQARGRAQAIQDQAVAAVLDDVGQAPVISRQLVRGDAGEALVHASRGAGYLVVGTQRKGALKRAILGSVSNYCVRHATCPVLVVPEGKPEPEHASRELTEKL